MSPNQCLDSEFAGSHSVSEMPATAIAMTTDFPSEYRGAAPVSYDIISDLMSAFPLV